MRVEVDKWGLVLEEPVNYIFLICWLQKKDKKIGDVNDKNNLSAIEYVTKLIKVDGRGEKK